MIRAGPELWTTAASWSGANACLPGAGLPTSRALFGRPASFGARCVGFGYANARSGMAGESERTGLGVPPMDDLRSRCQPGRMGGTAVDEHRGAVGQFDVGVVARPHPGVGEAASGLSSVPPDDLARLRAS